MNKLYVKCDGCDGCKRYMLEDSREENDFCSGTGYRTADGKSVKQIRLEKEVKASLERIHAFVEELKQKCMLPLGILLLLLGGCEQQRSELPPPAPLGCNENIRTMSIATRLACARYYYIRGCALGDGESCTAVAKEMLNHPVEE